MENIQKIAITGGQCAGKSVVLDSLKERFGDDVVMVPEVSTQLLEVSYDEGGIGVPGQDVEWSQKWQDRFQKMIIEKQIADETYYAQLADKRDRPTVVVCDRGVLDGAAYLAGGREEFMQKFNLTQDSCFNLYDKVIHLNSLATDAPTLYEDLKMTNPARFEDAPKAKELDENLYKVWEGHEGQIRIQSREGIEQKIELVASEIQKTLDEIREGKKELQKDIEKPSSLPLM